MKCKHEIRSVLKYNDDLINIICLECGKALVKRKRTDNKLLREILATLERIEKIVDA